MANSKLSSLVMIVITLTCSKVLNSDKVEAQFDVTKYLQLEPAVRGISKLEEIGANYGRVERKLMEDVQDQEMTRLMTNAFGQMSGYLKIRNPFELAERKGPTTTKRPYHGQIPRPSVVNHSMS